MYKTVVKYIDILNRIKYAWYFILVCEHKWRDGVSIQGIRSRNLFKEYE